MALGRGLTWLVISFVLTMSASPPAQALDLPTVFGKIVTDALKSSMVSSDFRSAANTCFQSKDPKVGISSCTAALKYKLSDHDNAELFHQRGLHFYKDGDRQRAEKDFDNALAYQPDHALALYNRAGMKELRGDTEGALADYRRSVSINPDYRPARDGATRMETAVAAEQTPAVNNGWCQLWRASDLLRQQRCSESIACDPEGGEICEVTYSWSGGGQTTTLIEDGFLSRINGRSILDIASGADPCIFDPSNDTTFCFTENRQEPASNSPAGFAEPDELIACQDLLATKRYDLAEAEGCGKIRRLCFGENGPTSSDRRSETRGACLRYQLAYATSTVEERLGDKVNAAEDLLANPVAHDEFYGAEIMDLQRVLLAQKERRGEIDRMFADAAVDTALPSGCLSDAKAYGYGTVYDKNPECHSAIDRCIDTVSQSDDRLSAPDCKQYLTSWRDSAPDGKLPEKAQLAAMEVATSNGRSTEPGSTATALYCEEGDTVEDIVNSAEPCTETKRCGSLSDGTGFCVSRYRWASGKVTEVIYAKDEDAILIDGTEAFNMNGALGTGLIARKGSDLLFRVSESDTEPPEDTMRSLEQEVVASSEPDQPDAELQEPSQENDEQILSSGKVDGYRDFKFGMSESQVEELDRRFCRDDSLINMTGCYSGSVDEISYGRNHVRLRFGFDKYEYVSSALEKRYGPMLFEEISRRYVYKWFADFQISIFQDLAGRETFYVDYYTIDHEMVAEARQKYGDSQQLPGF